VRKGGIVYDADSGLLNVNFSSLLVSS
jgi:hypothetical protein